MNDKDFFSKLAGVGPDGKFTSYKSNGNGKNGNGQNSNNKVETNSINKTMADNLEEKNEAVDEEEGQLAVDVYATLSAFVIESAIAGVKGDDIDVAITIDSVTIRGKRTKEEKDAEKEYLYQECFWGRFGRTIILPSEIDSDRATASFKNGVLRVVLPKILRDKPRKLRVRSDQ